MTAQEAYAEDCKRCPNYDGGDKRIPWDQLGTVCQSAWIKNPTPRTFKQGRGVTA